MHVESQLAIPLGDQIRPFECVRSYMNNNISEKLDPCGKITWEVFESSLFG